ncbi:hypothetical protein [Streptomyces sp. NPDC048473]|uniref:hypothetical protein n=1 Tax=unclassified Streptomyces TaxID=2593676 RepID=UPI0037102F45
MLTWFAGQGSSDPHVDVSALPALVGLYVELGPLRAHYGLRALRFAFLEAGHLAQNLAPSRQRPQGCPWVWWAGSAHELFMLDGIDDVLACLLPVNRLQHR